VLQLLKNSLDVHLDGDSAWTQLRGPFPRRTLHEKTTLLPASVQGLEAALSAWKKQASTPGSARLTLGTRLVTSTLISGAMTRATALESAHRRLADAMGTASITVSLSLLPGGRHWLAGAVQDDVVQPWIDLLVAHRIRLSSIRTELSDRLNVVRTLSLPDDAILAIPAQSESTLVYLASGRIAAIDWEEHGSEHPKLLAERARAGWHRLHMPERPSPALIAAVTGELANSVRKQLSEAGFQIQLAKSGGFHAQH
jgi:hypothetical protein